MKTRYILSGALLATFAVGCTDLDVDVKSYYTEYPNSEIATSAKTATVYNAFRGVLGRRFDEGNSMNSDEYTGVSFDGDYLNNRDCANFSLHTIDPTNSKNQLNVYNDIQSGITQANPLIVEFGEDGAAAAPLRAIRAWYHFLLMEHWGDIPIMDHTLGEDEIAERQPRADVARWIESELLAVRDKCPSTVDASTYGTPTCWMVDALLAKLYLNWPVYTKDVTSSSWEYGTNEKLQDCIDACDRVIASGNFALAGGDVNPNPSSAWYNKNDFKMKFFYTNGSDVKDFIYAIAYDAATMSGTMTYARFRTWRRGQNNNGLYSIEMAKSVGGNFALTPEYVALFNLPGDRRNDCIVGDATQDTTIVYQIDAATGEKTDVLNTYKGEQAIFKRTITLSVESGDLNCGANMTGWCQGYRSIKFMPNITEYNTYDRGQSNDIPIFRYADILLMKAEALVRQGNGGAKDLFNQIRSYAGAPTISAEPSLQDIEDERGREFLDEHWRRNDLIRMGHFERSWGFKDLYGSNDPAMRLWPLSVDVLNNNTNWKQNAGYVDPR